MSGLHDGAWRLVWRNLLLLLFFAANAVAQAGPASRTFQVSRIQVEQALKKLPAYPGGRLPLLDGFVVPGDAPLDRYQQGYYQYSVQVVATNDAETMVSATARVTAWYVDDNPSKSGYRSLPSNGRLEADLFDRLQDVLDGKQISQQTAPPQEQSKPAPPRSSAVSGAAPDAASSAQRSSVFTTPESLTSAMAAKLQNAPAEKTAEDIRLQQLQQEARNLEEMLHNQSRPNNLASIKDAKAPVYARPAAGSKVLLVAEMRDEFQVLSAQADWVHVQIAGPSRGWIRRSQVDMSSVTAEVASTESGDAGNNTGPFERTHDETATFPGTWELLRGKMVKIVWVKITSGRKDGAEARSGFAKSLFRKTFPTLTNEGDKVEGVVIVFDSADGGMVATTLPALQQWTAGRMTDDAFWRQCWLDPPEAFGKSAGR